MKLSNNKATDSSIYFQSGYVFFMEYRGSSIVRMDENGDNEKVLFDKDVYKYRVYDGKIYFINVENRKLYSSDLEGEDLKIEIDSTFSGLRIEDGYLYLLGKHEQVDLKLYFESGKIEEVPE